MTVRPAKTQISLGFVISRLITKGRPESGETLCLLCQAPSVVKKLPSVDDMYNLEQETNLWICKLAPENGFSEIIFISFGRRQYIFTILFGTKFVVICAAEILKIG